MSSQIFEQIANGKINQTIQFLRTKETVTDRLFFTKEDQRDGYYDAIASNNKWLRIDRSHAKEKGAKLYVSGNEKQFQYNYCYIETISNTDGNVRESRYRTYYFIYDVEQINANVIELTLALDVWGTYFTKINFGKQVYVERCTPLSDNFGENRVDEFYNLGEYKPIYAKAMRPSNGKYGYLISCAEYPCDNGKFECKSSVINGVFSGLSYFFYKSSELTEFNNFLNFYNTHGHIDAIVAITTFPEYRQITEKNPMKTVTFKDTSRKLKFREACPSALEYNYISEKFDIGGTETLQTLNVPHNGYIPKCKKLLQYPYTFYELENGNGGAVQYRPENVLGEKVEIESDTTLRIPPDIEFYLKNYNDSSTVNRKIPTMRSLPISGYGLITWSSDYTKTWLAQNSDQLSATKQNTISTFNTTKANNLASLNTSNAVAENTYAASAGISGNNLNMASKKNKYDLVWNEVNTGMQTVGDAASLVTSHGMKNKMNAFGGVLSDGVDAIKNYTDYNMSNMTSQNAYNNAMISADTSLTNSLLTSTTAYTQAQLSATTAYNNAMRSLNASVAAISNYPSSIKGDTSTSHLDLIRQTNDMLFTIIQGDKKLMSQVDHYMQLYGYAQEKFMNIGQILFTENPVWGDNINKGCVYLKTVGADFTSQLYTDVPQIYIDAINDILNTGIRIWHEDSMSIEYSYNGTEYDGLEIGLIPSNLELRGTGLQENETIETTNLSLVEFLKPESIMNIGE